MVILNYNGAKWLPRCLESLRAQSCFDRIEVIVADNASPDGSEAIARQLLVGWNSGQVVQNGGNYGYCEGNNRGAQHAKGRYLLFLNNDTWMAPDCLERLIEGMDDARAGAGSPQILNYVDQQLQGYGRSGFDLSGYYSNQWDEGEVPTELFIAPGCAYCIRRDLFWELGGFDPQFFMYVDETDLSWRVWIRGERVICVAGAKLFHWGAGATEAERGVSSAPVKVSEFARYHTNRNQILTLMKNAQHFLLLLLVPHLIVLFLEAVFVLGVSRNLRFVCKAYVQAVIDAWGKRDGIAKERARIAGYRRRGDWQMLRFFRWIPARWEEVKGLWRRGLPQVR